MPRHRIALPPDLWPEDLRTRFETHPLSSHQRSRLRSALGRWLKTSRDRGLDARDVSRETWRERTGHLHRSIQNDVRRALAIAFPDLSASLYQDDHSLTTRSDDRIELRRAIALNLARFPSEWREAAEPLLHVDEMGLGDGLLVQAWAPSTIVRRVQTAASHFDFCQRNGFAADITPDSIRAWLRKAQVKVEKRERRLGGVEVHLEALTGLAMALQPRRSWSWLKTARDRIKKLARQQGSRNAGRAVDAAELRAAGLQLLEQADAAHAVARNRRAFVMAHSLARTALTMIFLSEAPIRIKGCAEIELHGGLLSDLAGLFLDQSSTKERDTDCRMFSATLVDAIGRYLRHRAVIAAPGETRFLVGERGGPIKSAQLSTWLGKVTEHAFGVRVTPHAIRHSVANFIVATAPEEAALASLILNHRSDAVTPVYTQRADQIAASKRLKRAAEATAAELKVNTLPTRRTSKRTSPRMPSRGGRRGVKARL